MINSLTELQKVLAAIISLALLLAPEIDPLFEEIHAINLEIEYFSNTEFGIDPFGHTRTFIESSQVHIFPHLAHGNRIRKIGHRNPQFVGYILLGSVNLHRPVQLQTRYQISGSA
jgi:hypothetical protein